MLCSDETSFLRNDFQTLLLQKFVKPCCDNVQVASLLWAATGQVPEHVVFGQTTMGLILEVDELQGIALSNMLLCIRNKYDSEKKQSG